MINKLLCTLFTWSQHFHMSAVGGLKNVETVYNICSPNFSCDCQKCMILNPFVRCVDVWDNICVYSYVPNRNRSLVWYQVSGEVELWDTLTNPTIKKLRWENLSLKKLVAVAPKSCWKITHAWLELVKLLLNV